MADEQETDEGRTPLVAGNWKMHKLRADARAFCAELAAGLDEVDAIDLAICPPLSCLADVADALVPVGVGVYAQTAHGAASGAFTGEVSMAMLVDVGATGVLLGHSERRQLFAETDEALAEKVPAALAAGLEPVLCIGETLEEREGGATEAVLRRQVEIGLRAIATGAIGDVVVAYEPVWAIGTGRVATPEIAQAAHAHVRAVLRERHGDDAERVRILYGGSMKPDNAAALIGLPDVDGGLVGGASLEAASLLAIARAALA